MGINWECNSDALNCTNQECEKCEKNKECKFCKNKESELCASCEYKRKLGELKKERLRSYLINKSMQERIEAELEECRGENNINDRLQKQKESCQKTCMNIIAEIERLRNEDEKNVLFCRYIQGKKWEEICVQLSISWRNIHYIHKRALENYRTDNKKRESQTG